MRDLCDQIEAWLSSGRKVALATVIKTWGSSPRPAGAGMAISDLMEIAGSVSGGCVEGAVIDAGMEVLETGESKKLHFGVGDEEAWEVGLSCGGEIDVFIRRFDEEDLKIWKTALSNSDPVLLGLVLEGNAAYQGKELFLDDGGLSGVEKTGRGMEPLRDILESSPTAGIYQVGSPEIKEIFIYPVKPPPELILVGGAHVTIPLVSLANTVGFEVTVIDPRRIFSREERFPNVKLLLPDWPDKAFKKIKITGSTAVVMLTHDPKIDDPALAVALNSPAFYVGALGSRKTHQKRVQRLQAAGLDQEKIDRIHGPVGLDLGGKTPPAIALGIMAEILQVWYDRKRVDDGCNACPGGRGIQRICAFGCDQGVGKERIQDQGCCRDQCRGHGWSDLCSWIFSG